MHPDFPAYQRLHQRMKELADRWVLAWGEYGYRGGANNVRFSEAYGAGEHPYGERIEFYAHYVDGIGRNGSFSSKYLDDDTTLEIDSKVEYDNEQTMRRQRSAEISRLSVTPDVKAYKVLQEGYTSSQFFPWTNSATFPLL